MLRADLDALFWFLRSASLTPAFPDGSFVGFVFRSLVVGAIEGCSGDSEVDVDGDIEEGLPVSLPRVAVSMPFAPANLWMVAMAERPIQWLKHAYRAQ